MGKTWRKRNTGVAMAVVFAFLALCAPTDVTYGAIGIDTEAECGLTFDLSVNYRKPEAEEGGELKSDDFEKTAGYEELERLPVKVKLYKVADVSPGGKYVEPAEGDTGIYQALKSDLENVNSQTKAAQWMAMAERAMGEVEKAQDLKAAAGTTINEPGPGDGKTIEKLATGLYLVVVEEVESPEYIYTFTPYLVSLPGNAYQEGDEDDAWLYEVTVGLKAGREDRYGDLEIVKTLKAYNTTLGGATFIFRIEAVKTVDDVEEVVYSDVVSVVFDSAGTKSIKIAEKIPAGATVTVTEVYTGASYEVTSDARQTTVIVAHDPDDPDNPDNLASVEFVNDYDNRLNGGTSIVNHFDYTEPGEENNGTEGHPGAGGTGTTEGVWDYKQMRDSTEETGRTGEHEE